MAHPTELTSTSMAPGQARETSWVQTALMAGPRVNTVHLRRSPLKQSGCQLGEAPHHGPLRRSNGVKTKSVLTQMGVKAD
jgi:hypothetical protein